MHIRYWTPEKCIAALDAFIQREEKAPVSRQVKQKNNLPSFMTFKSVVGMSYSQYIQIYYPYLVTSNSQPKNMWTRASCLIAFDKFVKTNGRLPNYREMNRTNHLPVYQTFTSYTGMTPKAYGKSKYPDLAANSTWRHWTRELIEDAVRQFTEQHGRRPKASEWVSVNHLPTPVTFRSVMGMTPKEYMSLLDQQSSGLDQEQEQDGDQGPDMKLSL